MKVSALIAVLLLVCGSVCQAQPVVRMVTINVNVKNSTTSAADFRGRILAPDGSTVLSATGLPESFAISLPSDNAVSDYNYVLTLSFGERYEQYFLNVREVHLGKSYSWDIDGTNIDVTQRSTLIQNICNNSQPNIQKYLQRLTFCRAMYFSYDPSEDYLYRFVALKGWFDANIALASMKLSPFAIDPDLAKTVRDLEADVAANRGPTKFRGTFPVQYVEAQLSLAKRSQLADLQEIPNLIKVGDTATAMKVNERAKALFDELTSVSPTKSPVVNGVTNDVLTGNQKYLQTLTQGSGPKGGS